MSPQCPLERLLGWRQGLHTGGCHSWETEGLTCCSKGFVCNLNPLICWPDEGTQKYEICSLSFLWEWMRNWIWEEIWLLNHYLFCILSVLCCLIVIKPRSVSLLCCLDTRIRQQIMKFVRVNSVFLVLLLSNGAPLLLNFQYHEKISYIAVKINLLSILNAKQLKYNAYYNIITSCMQKHTYSHTSEVRFIIKGGSFYWIKNIQYRRIQSDSHKTHMSWFFLMHQNI